MKIKTYAAIATALAPLFWAGAVSAGATEALGKYQLPSGRTVVSMNLDEMTKAAYASCAGKTIPKGTYPDQADDVDTPSTIASEDDVMSQSTDVVARCVSEYEGSMLSDKKSALGDKGDLTIEEKKRLAEIQAGIACGTNSVSEATLVKSSALQLGCLSDLRIYEWYSRKKYPASTFLPGNQSWKSMSDVFYKDWGNAFIFYPGLLGSISGFGLVGFDKLPPLPYETRDIFDAGTFVGAINMFSLSLIGILILYFFFRKSTDRESDDYRTFFAKIGLVLLITLGFPVAYNALRDMSTNIDASFISAFSGVLDRDMIARGISPTVFASGGLNTITVFTLICFIPNILGLLFISVAIIVRGIFLQFVAYIFFVFAIGLLVGTFRKDNMMEASDLVGKGSKKLMLGLFWAISLFISVVISIVLFKILSLFFGFVGSVELSGKSILDNIGAFGLDAMVYILAIVAVMWAWYKWILPTVYATISEFFTGIFMPQAQRMHVGDFYGQVSEGYETIRKEYDDMRLNNPEYLATFSPVTEMVGDGVSALKENSSIAKRLLEHPQLTEEQSMLRRGMKTVAKLATGAGETGELTIQLERRRAIEKADAKLAKLNQELSQYPESDEANAAERRKITARMSVVENERKELQAKYDNHADEKTMNKKLGRSEKLVQKYKESDDDREKDILLSAATTNYEEAKKLESTMDMRSAEAEISSLDLKIRPLERLVNDGHSDVALQLDSLMEKRRATGERLAANRTAKNVPDGNETAAGSAETPDETVQPLTPEPEDAKKGSTTKKKLEIPSALAMPVPEPMAPPSQEPSESTEVPLLSDDEMEFVRKYREAKSAGGALQLQDFADNKVVSETLAETFSSFGSIDGMEKDLEAKYNELSSKLPEPEVGHMAAPDVQVNVSSITG